MVDYILVEYWRVSVISLSQISLSAQAQHFTHFGIDSVYYNTCFVMVYVLSPP